MADSSALADSLDLAANVFGLARTLGWDFQQDFKSRGAVVMAGDEPPRKKHQAKIGEFIEAVLDSSDAVKNPPDGFESVANQLRIAGRLSKQLKQNAGDILGLFPELNTLAYEGYQAVKAARNDTQPDDPFAVFEEPQDSDESTVIDAADITPTWDEIQTKIQSSRDRIRHPNPSHNPNRRACDAYNDYATISRMLDKCGINGPQLPDQRFHPDQTLAYIHNSLDDVELTVNGRGAKVEQSTKHHVADKSSSDVSMLDAAAGKPVGVSEDLEVVKVKNRSGEKAAEMNARPTESIAPRPFSGGTMAFFEDRVELCGVDICSGRRSQTRRRILELLCKKRKDGSFEAYSGDEMALELRLRGGKGSVSGAIRDLRRGNSDILRNQQNLLCDLEDG